MNQTVVKGALFRLDLMPCSVCSMLSKIRLFPRPSCCSYSASECVESLVSSDFLDRAGTAECGL